MKFFRNFFRPFNIFTVLMIIAGFAFAFRLVNVFTFKNQPVESVGAIMPAGAQEAVNEQPPPLTKDEIEKAVKETARKADEIQSDSGDQKPADAAAVPAATSTTTATATATTTTAPAADDGAQANPPPPDDLDTHAFSASELDVLQSLSKRRDDLDAREKKIAEREALLNAAGQEVDQKIAELNKLKGEIQGLLGTQQKMEEDRLVSLVKIYEGMKPKEAATIFNTLDLDVLLEVIGRMNERKSSPVLAAMDPEKARIVTIKLAEMKKLPAAVDSSGKKMPEALPAPAPEDTPDDGSNPASP